MPSTRAADDIPNRYDRSRRAGRGLLFLFGQYPQGDSLYAYSLLRESSIPLMIWRIPITNKKDGQPIGPVTHPSGHMQNG
jgi:hypothetical protein